ncbi:MAG: galactose mutarotase [Desulfosarcinaceae bacterium]|jgi:aldose 1-epimerase
MVKQDLFGTTGKGRPVHRVTLENEGGIRAEILTYGALLHRLAAPDKNGHPADILMGTDTLAGYEANTAYFGAMVGRCANRIRKGRFQLAGTVYQLALNHGEDHLHGGPIGFDRAVWEIIATTAPPRPSVTLKHISPHGDQGYPGELEVRVTYALDEAGRLTIDCRATSDALTIVNLANHAYFNLSGDCRRPIDDHLLWIDADRYTPVSAAVIPTGELAPVTATPFDFRVPTAIGSRINSDHQQIRRGEGYDHNFVLNRPGHLERPAAWACHPESGRLLTVYTSQPGIQFYSGNHIAADVPGKNRVENKRRHAFCLETQHFPDAVNQDHFPPVTLRPEERYHQTTIYAVGIRGGSERRMR